MSKRAIRRRIIAAAAGVLGVLVALHSIRSADDVPAAASDAKLPGAGRAMALLDGAAVCHTPGAWYLSTNDPLKWALLPMETGGAKPINVFFCVGGGRDRLFFVGNTGKSINDNVVGSLVPGAGWKDVRRLSGALGRSTPVAFCTDKIGVVSTGANVGVTVDGGATWHPTPPLFDDQRELISMLKWVDKSRLLIAGPINDSLALYEVQPNASLRLAWRIKPSPDVDPQLALRQVAADDNDVWVIGKEQFRRLKLADGKEDFTIPRQNFEAQIGTAHGTLLAWTPDNLQVNTVKPDGTFNRSKRFPIHVAGILPLEKPHCLVISQEGEGFDLDLDAGKLAPTNLQVTPKWSTPRERTAEEKRGEELGLEIMRLGAQLPNSETAPLEKAALAKTELTWEQRATWLIGEYKKLLAKYKAEGRVPKLDPKPLVLQIVDLAHQLFGDEVEQVWEDSRKKKLGAPAKQQQWVKEQMEKLIAKHKADGTLPKPKSDPPDDGAQK